MADAFIDFIEGFLAFGGTTTAALNGNHESKVVFFQPIASPANFAFRSLCIVTAPLVLTVASVVVALIGLFYLPCSALLNAVHGDNEAAIEDITEAGTFILSAGIALLAAAISPLVEIVDVTIGLGKACVDGGNSSMEYN